MVRRAVCEGRVRIILASLVRHEIMIRAGIDSGSVWIGLVIAEGDAPPLRLLIPPRRIEVGHLVPVANPKPWLNRDGTPRLREDGTMMMHDRRREVTDADEHNAASEVMAEIVRYGAERVVCETVKNVFIDGKVSSRGNSAKATRLKTSGQVLARIKDRCRSLGLEIAEPLLASWRSRVVGKASATDAETAPAVTSKYIDWPEDILLGREGRDQRDAGGVLLWDVIPAPHAARAARVASAKAEPGARVKLPPKPRGPSMESRILAVLEGGSLRNGELAVVLGVSPGRVSYVAGQMVRSGLLRQGGHGRPYERIG